MNPMKKFGRKSPAETRAPLLWGARGCRRLPLVWSEISLPPTRGYLPYHRWCASLFVLRVHGMKSCRSQASWSHRMLRAWVIVWMLAVPVFHVHPDTDHHGEAGHIHGGTIHTVFSSDLDGEYDHQHATDGFRHSTSSHLALSDHPSHSLDNAELAFSYLTNSIDRKPLKPLSLHGLTVEPCKITEFAPPIPDTHHLVISPSRTFLTPDIPSRAPPSLLV